MGKDTEKRSCLFPDCGKDNYCRGLCGSHYVIARRLVIKGETTWEALEQRNCASPARKHAMQWFLGEKTSGDNTGSADSEQDDWKSGTLTMEPAKAKRKNKKESKENERDERDTPGSAENTTVTPVGESTDTIKPASDAGNGTPIVKRRRGRPRKSTDNDDANSSVSRESAGDNAQLEW